MIINTTTNVSELHHSDVAMMEGKVALSGGPELAARLEQEGKSPKSSVTSTTKSVSVTK